MRRIDWADADDSTRRGLLQRPAQGDAAAVFATAGAILEDVALRGDAAVREYAARFDAAAPGAALEVPRERLDAAAATLAPALRAAIDEAAARIEDFHRACMAPEVAIETAPGLRCERLQRPIGTVGLYVPGGSAPLPSTALMLAVPAMLAGCPQVVLCSPPAADDGLPDATVLAVAARVPGVRVFAIGGAQAIGAMALGTRTVPRCDKLFGPGNAYVDAAKQLAARRPGGPAIDLPAGPSELMVIADAGANPGFVAADLLSQAEHGPDSQVLLLSDDRALLDAVDAALAAQLSTLPRAAIARAALAGSPAILVPDLAAAFAIANDYAPEHLSLALRAPREWLDRVASAGSVFLGDWTPETLGDYCSGSNHVLPTGGHARAWSGLSVAAFRKSIAVQEASREALAEVGPCAVTLARAEGLQAHARAVELRLERAA
ncbi:MAG: histidinol dehydrogenase [Lysobacteraceae bacterium]|nr:MAG: histidinol dehydrogenase [Xanthomonadaceae bacterium]